MAFCRELVILEFERKYADASAENGDDGSRKSIK